jgi:hypothetical protein
MVHNFGHHACLITLSASEKTLTGMSSPIAMAVENEDLNVPGGSLWRQAGGWLAFENAVDVGTQPERKTARYS